MRARLLIAVFAVFGAFGIGGWAHWQAKARPTKPGASREQLVVATTAKRQDLLITVSETGVLAAKHSTPVIPEISGRIEWICENGIIASAGDVLLRLDSKPFAEALTDLGVRLANSERGRAQAEAVGQSRQAELRLRLQRGQDDLAAFARQQQVDLQRVADTIKLHEEELERVREDAATTRRLAAKGLVAGTEVERKEAEVRAAEFSLQRERGDYELKKSQAAADALNKERSVGWTTRDMSWARGFSQRNVRMGANEVENLTVQVQRAKEDLAETTLTAPVAGIVVLAPQGGQQGDAHLPRPGDYAPSGKELASIVSLDRMQVELELDQREIAGVRMGQPADVTVEALPGRVLKGVISSIGQNARRPPVQGWTGFSSSATFPVTVDLPPSGKALIRPGMRASVSVVSQRIKDVVTVPTGGVFWRGSRSVVFVERRGRFVQAPVTTGPSNGEYTAITQGLAGGERIALNDLGARPPTGTPSKEQAK